MTPLATDGPPSAGELRRRIDDRSARLAVIGLGYVGLPLAVALAEAGFRVKGIDLDAKRVAAIRGGRSPIKDIDDERLNRVSGEARLAATDDYSVLAECDVVFVCVPTPFDANKTPDLRYVHSAADGIADHLHAGQLVVLQSTTYPGTTEEAILPRLERSGLKAGRDFFLAFCPERIDPGVPEHTVHNTPKVVGGITPYCTDLAAEVLSTLGTDVHRVSSPRVAEMTKLLENIFRSVNIALVNELALLSEQMGIDIWEVVDAAATKPFGFMPFRPGAGVGGHCIPIDPYYLSWKAREYDFSTRFIELAADINQAMPRHVVQLVARSLDESGIPVRGARILVLGVAFKPDVDDPRNSPAERVMEILLSRGADIRYHDPYIPEFRIGANVFCRQRAVLQSVPLTDEEVRSADAVVVLAGHKSIDYAEALRSAKLVVDTANVVASTSEARRQAGERAVELRGQPSPRADGGALADSGGPHEPGPRLVRLGAPSKSS